MNFGACTSAPQVLLDRDNKSASVRMLVVCAVQASNIAESLYKVDWEKALSPAAHVESDRIALVGSVSLHRNAHGKSHAAFIVPSDGDLEG